MDHLRSKAKCTRTNPTHADIRDAFYQLQWINENATAADYARYVRENPYADLYQPPMLRVLHSSNAQARPNPWTIWDERFLEDESSGVVASYSPLFIQYRSMMGYSPGRRCYAFRGQRILINRFLSFTIDRLLHGQILRVEFLPLSYRFPSHVCHPRLTYYEFASCGEDWACFIFLQPNVIDPLNLDELPETWLSV
ncbi:hypothetical protein E4U21_004080 [Claviceps maximensis]|nr:hypothetical protein E4U21_004080 [Claviceps maximensis]